MRKIVVAAYQAGKKFVAGANNKSKILADEAAEILAKENKKKSFSFGTPIKENNSYINSSNDSILTAMEQQGRQLFVQRKTPTFGPISGGLPGLKYKGCFKNSDYEPISNIKAICEEFKKDTGIELHCPDNYDLRAFDESLISVMTLKKRKQLPEEIKHLIIGHGTGASIDGTWRFQASGENVFNYINKTPSIKKGDTILLATCEEGAAVNGMPGLGQHAVTPFFESYTPDGTLLTGGKIVKAGENKIYGYFTTNLDRTTCSITPYKY